MTYKKKSKNVYTWYKAVSHNYRSNIDFKGSRDKIMFLISVLLAGLMKKEFMSIWGRKLKNLFLECFIEDWIPVATFIEDWIPVDWIPVASRHKVSCASFIFINSGWGL